MLESKAGSKHVMQQTAQKKELFENMPVPRAIITMAIPTIISQIIILIYNMADTFFIGRTGNSLMVAGMSVCYTIVVLTTAFTNLFGIGGGNLVSRLNGRGEYDKARKFCSMAFWGGLTAAVIYALVILIFMEPFLYALGASANTIGYAKQYTTIVVVAGAIPNVMSVVLAQLLRTVGYSKQASYGLSGGGILNIILDPLFMFVIFPAGNEIAGAAVATLLSNTLSCLFLLWMFFRVSKKATLSADPRRLREMSSKDAGLLLKTGFPSALLFALFDVSNMFLFSIMSKHGDLAVAAIGIVIKIERIPNQIGIGIAQSLSPLVAYNLGSGNLPRMKKFISTGRIYGIVMTLCCILIYQLFAGPFCGFFMSTRVGDVEKSLATIALATVFLRFRCCASPMMYLNYHSSYCLQAMGGVKGAVIHTIIRIIVVTIPLMFLMDHLWGAYGLSASLVAAETISAVVAVLILQKHINKIHASKV